ncbi:MAG: hypothetical protein AB1714_05475 [Acidobacteriota bacterium]
MTSINTGTPVAVTINNSHMPVDPKEVKGGGRPVDVTINNSHRPTGPEVAAPGGADHFERQGTGIFDEMLGGKGIPQGEMAVGPEWSRPAATAGAKTQAEQVDPDNRPPLPSLVQVDFTRKNWMRYLTQGYPGLPADGAKLKWGNINDKKKMTVFDPDGNRIDVPCSSIPPQKAATNTREMAQKKIGDYVYTGRDEYKNGELVRSERTRTDPQSSRLYKYEWTRNKDGTTTTRETTIDPQGTPSSQTDTKTHDRNGKLIKQSSTKPMKHPGYAPDVKELRPEPNQPPLPPKPSR